MSFTTAVAIALDLNKIIDEVASLSTIVNKTTFVNAAVAAIESQITSGPAAGSYHVLVMNLKDVQKCKEFCLQGVQAYTTVNYRKFCSTTYGIWVFEAGAIDHTGLPDDISRWYYTDGVRTGKSKVVWRSAAKQTSLIYGRSLGAISSTSGLSCQSYELSYPLTAIAVYGNVYKPAPSVATQMKQDRELSLWKQFFSSCSESSDIQGGQFYVITRLVFTRTKNLKDSITALSEKTGSSTDSSSDKTQTGVLPALKMVNGDNSSSSEATNGLPSIGTFKLTPGTAGGSAGRGVPGSQPVQPPTTSKIFTQSLGVQTKNEKLLGTLDLYDEEFIQSVGLKTSSDGVHAISFTSNLGRKSGYFGSKFGLDHEIGLGWKGQQIVVAFTDFITHIQFTSEDVPADADKKTNPDTGKVEKNESPKFVANIEFVSNSDSASASTTSTSKSSSNDSSTTKGQTVTSGEFVTNITFTDKSATASKGTST